MKVLIDPEHSLLQDCAFGPYVCCQHCVLGFSAFVPNLSKFIEEIFCLDQCQMEISCSQLSISCHW